MTTAVAGFDPCRARTLWRVVRRSAGHAVAQYMTRLLVAGALAASLTAVSAPAHAQPCVVPPVSPTISTCVLNLGASGRGASVVIVGTGYAFVLAGCYYPDGRPHYYVGAGSSVSSLVEVTVPVSAVPCV
jgi:hypothetical protein